MTRKEKYLAFLESAAKASPKNAELLGKIAAGFRSCFESEDDIGGDGLGGSLDSTLSYDGEPVTLYCGQYGNGNTAVQLRCQDGPFCNMTVNVEKMEPGFAAIDTNNAPEMESFINKNNLGTKVRSVQSGFCEYPVYKLNMEEIHKHCVPEEGIA